MSGEVEIWYQWRYNPLLDFEPFTDVESDKAPNVLRVGLSQGRGLAVMDKNLLSKGGSSDPRCVISLVDGDGAAPALCGCLRPSCATRPERESRRWRMSYAIAVAPTNTHLPRRHAIDATPRRRRRRQAHYVGAPVQDARAEVARGPRLRLRGRFPGLQVRRGGLRRSLSKADHGRRDRGAVRAASAESRAEVAFTWAPDKGEVELVLQWCYDADRDFEAFPEIDESGKDAQ